MRCFQSRDACHYKWDRNMVKVKNFFVETLLNVHRCSQRKTFKESVAFQIIVLHFSFSRILPVTAITFLLSN